MLNSSICRSPLVRGKHDSALNAYLKERNVLLIVFDAIKEALAILALMSGRSILLKISFKLSMMIKQFCYACDSRIIW